MFQNLLFKFIFEYLRINMPTAGCILIGTKSADEKNSWISECAKQRRQSGRERGKKGRDSWNTSSVKNAPLRETEKLRYLWRQLNSQEHMILTRRASRGGIKGTWEGTRLDAIVYTSPTCHIITTVNLFPFILYEWRSGVALRAAGVISFRRSSLIRERQARYLWRVPGPASICSIVNYRS